MSSTEVIHVPHEVQDLAQDFMPVFSIEQAVKRQQQMSEYIGKILNDGSDYGTIPGGQRQQKVLLKPGAEKLCTFFGLSPHFEPEVVTEDWVGTPEHGGEPLFYYRYKCQLYRGDRFVAEAVGSCNSREKKYRYRNSERVCPSCSQAAIIKGKAEYGGGWLCFKKKGGCGAKFSDGDASIEGQEVGQVANPDIGDLINTLQKMAQKRALVAAVLIGTNASDSFTQDVEDSIDEPHKPESTKADGRPIPGSLQHPVQELRRGDKSIINVTYKWLEDELIHADPRKGAETFKRLTEALRAKYPKGKLIPTEEMISNWLDLWDEARPVIVPLADGVTDEDIPF